MIAVLGRCVFLASICLDHALAAEVSWRELLPDAGGAWPPPRSGAAAVTLSDGRLLLFGGEAEDGTMADLWQLRLRSSGTAEWKQLSHSPSADWPEGGTGYVAVALADDSVLMLQKLRTLWRLVLEANDEPQWERMSDHTSDDWPWPSWWRLDSEPVVTSLGDSALVYSVAIRSTWVFTVNQNSWEELHPVGEWPADSSWHRIDTGVALPDGGLLVFVGEFAWKLTPPSGGVASSWAYLGSTRAPKSIKYTFNRRRYVVDAQIVGLPDGSTVFSECESWQFIPNLDNNLTGHRWENLTAEDRLGGFKAHSAWWWSGALFTFGGRSCLDGSYLDGLWRADGVCAVSCPADETVSADGVCTACQAGWRGHGRCDPCLPTLPHVLAQLDPSVRVASNDYGSISISVTLSPWPSSMVFEVQSLQIVLDVAETAEGLVPGSLHPSCQEQWVRMSDGHWDVNLTYDSVAQGPCALSERTNMTHVVHMGWMGIALAATLPNGEQQVVGHWVEPLIIPFDLLAGDASQLQGLEVYVGSAPSTLELFTNSNFDVEYYASNGFGDIGDFQNVYIQQTVAGSASSAMAVEKVWLSLSTDPAAPAEHNLTETMQTFPSQGSVRFSVQVQSCHKCYLHVLSRLTLTPLKPHHTVQHLGLSVGAPPEEEDKLDISMIIDVPVVFLLVIVLLISFFVSGVHFCLLKCCLEEDEGAKWMFFFLETLDVGSDILAYFLSDSNGDFDFEGGKWIRAALAVSTFGSVILFLTECALAYSDRLELGFFMSAHVLCEDTFQMLLYSLVTALNVKEGLGPSDALLFASVQSAIFLAGKFGEVLCSCGQKAEGEESRASRPTQQWLAATIGRYSW